MKTFVKRVDIIVLGSITCLRGVVETQFPACKLYHFVLYFAEAVVSSALSM